MPEFDYFNGENFITFDLIEIDDEKQEVTVAVSDTGRISVRTFDLLFDGIVFYGATTNMILKCKIAYFFMPSYTQVSYDSPAPFARRQPIFTSSHLCVLSVNHQYAKTLRIEKIF